MFKVNHYIFDHVEHAINSSGSVAGSIFK
jgi:hypothetical protein